MRLPAPARAVVALAVLGGSVALAVSLRRPPGLANVSTSAWLVAGVIGVMTIGSWVWPLVLYRGDQSEAFHLDEGFFVILALTGPPDLTLLTLAGATTVAQVIRRRPLVKSLFNVGQLMVSAGLGLAVSRALAAPAAHLTMAAVGAALLGVIVFFVVNTAFVTAVMVSMGSTWRVAVLDDLPIQWVLASAGSLVGAVLALGLEGRAWVLVLAVPELIAQRRLITARFRAQHDRARIKGLFEVALEANNSGLRSDAVLGTISGSARELLRCSDADVLVTPPPGAELAARIQVGGETRWLTVSGRRREEPFDEADRGLLDALAAVGTGALTNAELYRQVRYERERLASVALSIGEGVCAVDLAGQLTFVNPAAQTLVDLPDAAGDVDVESGDGGVVVPAPDFLLGPARAAIESGELVRVDDARFRRPDGGVVPVSYTASPVMDNGRAVGAVIAFRDITERKAFEDEMTHHAFYDSLTGLANRRLLVDQLEHLLGRSKLDRKTHALIFLDVDRFKSINDSLGHGSGDDLLVSMANRMRAAVRSQDLLSRFGGDEFVLLLEDVASLDEAVATAQRICDAVKEPVLLSGGYEIVASVSVGIALTEPGKTTDDVLRNADVAMYEAKVKGRGGSYQVFDITAMGARSSERLETEAALRKGVDRDELEVWFQPFYAVDDERIVGAEALVRWRHPAGGVVAPARFIDIAEETGLIVPIGRYVLEKACCESRRVHDRLGIDLPVSVNLSPRQFHQAHLVDDVWRILRDSRIDPGLLTLEITESMVMDDLAGAREVMKGLNRLGVRLAVDDFGTGHSSLRYVKQFPIQEIKVDRTFVQGVGDDMVDSAIVRAVIDLAVAMGITAVAEGVETVDQLAGLRSLQCPVAQGHFFSRALPPAKFEKLLVRRMGSARSVAARINASPLVG